MRNGEIVHRFGEHFIALIFDNLGFEADIVDADGIDLMCYKNGEDLCYGVSVKTRNIEFNSNNSINLSWKDIVYADEQTKLRAGKEPLYAFVITELSEVNVFVFTQAYMFEHYFAKKRIKNISEYKKKFPTKPTKENKMPGSTQGIDTGRKVIDSWGTLYQNKTKGIIFAGTYSLK